MEEYKGMASQQTKRMMVACFFALLTLIGIWTIGDYCGSYDEIAEQLILASNMKEYALQLEKLGVRWDTWLMRDDVPISQSIEKDHGISGYYLYGLLFPLVEQNEGLRYSLWSLFTWLWFMTGVWSLYAIARKMGCSRAMACVAALLLYLCPRFFADGHLNNKDVVLMCLILASLWLGMRYVEKPVLSRGLLFSLVGAMAMNTKIVGAIGWGLVFAGAALRMALNGTFRRRTLGTWLASGAAFAAFYLLLTPAAWSDPIGFFSYLLKNAAAFSRWNGTLFFRGAAFIAGKNPLPRYYLPYMMLTTLPVYLFVLYAVGQLAAAKELICHPGAFLKSERGILLSAATLCFILPAVGFVVITPLVYNGWRHFYFCFAGMAVVSAYGLQVIWQNVRTIRWMRCAGILTAAACLMTTAVGMVINHPHQASYYNVLASPQTMETDYWNTSGTEALRRLIACEERDESLPLEVGCYFMDIQNARFKLSDEEKAVLTTTTRKDSPYLYYIENYVQVYNVPVPEGYHELFTIESYGRLIGTMYERDT